MFELEASVSYSRSIIHNIFHSLSHLADTEKLKKSMEYA
jgi:hypothetical protein